MILGLDISTTIVGYSIISPKKKLLEYGYIKLPTTKKKTIEFIIKETSIYFKQKIKNILRKYEISNVYIEKPYTYFKGGGSSAHTMSLLMFFGGIVADYIFENFCNKIEYIDSKSTKKMLGIKTPKGLSQYKSKKFKKEETIKKINLEFPQFIIRKTKRGSFEKGLDDEADAISLALMHFFLDKGF